MKSSIFSLWIGLSASVELGLEFSLSIGGAKRDLDLGSGVLGVVNRKLSVSNPAMSSHELMISGSVEEENEGEGVGGDMVVVAAFDGGGESSVRRP